jgi:hypothetical protein
MVMPSRKRELIMRAVADIGGVGDLECRRVDALGASTTGDRQAVFVGEIEVALVMGRAAEDRAGAVFHQHEIGDIDRQSPPGIKRMFHADAGIEAELLGLFDGFLAVPVRWHSSMKAGIAGLFRAGEPWPAGGRPRSR